MIKELLVASTALLGLCNAFPSSIDDREPPLQSIAVPIDASVLETEDNNDLSPAATSQGYYGYNRRYGNGYGRGGWGGAGGNYGGGWNGGWGGYGIGGGYGDSYWR